MVDVVTRTSPITRSKLAQWLPNHEAVTTFEHLTADVPALGEAANDLQGQVDAATQRIGTLEGEVSTLQGQVAALTDRVTLLEAEVAALQSAVAEIDVLAAQAAYLRGQVSSVKQSINSISMSPYKP